MDVFVDTGVGEEFEELELAEGAEAEHGVVERRDLLDRDLAPGRAVDGGAHDAVRALADDVEHLVRCPDVEADLARRRLRRARRVAVLAGLCCC